MTTFYRCRRDVPPDESVYTPLVPRYSVPESFQRALSYEGQIQWLAHSFRDVWDYVQTARCTYVLATTDSYTREQLDALPGTTVTLSAVDDGRLPCVVKSEDAVLAVVRDTTAGTQALVIGTIADTTCTDCTACTPWTVVVRYVVRDLASTIDKLSESLRDELKTLDAKVERYHTELTQRVDATDGRVTTLETTVRDLGAKVERYNTEIRKLVSDLGDKVDANYTSLNTKIDTVNRQLGDRITALSSKVDELTTKVNDLTSVSADVAVIKSALASITSQVYGASYDAKTGKLTLPSGTRIPVGNLNFFSATASPSSSTYANALRSRDLSDNDVKSV